MPPLPLELFRKAATDHHFHRRSQSVLPDFLQHRLLGTLWLILLLAGGLVGVAWAQSTPQVVIGLGFVVPAREGSPNLVLLAPGTAPLAAGQRLVCDVDGKQGAQAVLEQVEPGITNLAGARAAHHLGPSLEFAPDQPLRVAHARLTPDERHDRALDARGACRVLITVGSRTLYSFLPDAISFGH